MTQLHDLAQEWLKAKEDERQAIERRRDLEDKMASMMSISPDLDGTFRLPLDDGTEVKVVGRIDRKVDYEAVTAIAMEHGLQQHVPHLFRAKLELNMRAWTSSDQAITRPFAAAITAKPGRPSFSVTKKEEG